MSKSDQTTHALYEGLQKHAASSFPKRCRTCGRLYHTVDDYLAETKFSNPNHAGLRSVIDNDGKLVLELFRRCPCGSTLMDIFNNRRDVSEEGIKRRNNFDQLMAMVQEKYHVDAKTAREELLKILDGERSELIDDIVPEPAAASSNPSKSTSMSSQRQTG